MQTSYMDAPFREAVRGGQNISCGGKLAVQEVNGRGFEEDRPPRKGAM